MQILTKPVLYTATFVGGVFIGWVARGHVDKRAHDKLAAQSLVASLQSQGMAPTPALLAQAGIVSQAATPPNQVIAAPVAPTPKPVQQVQPPQAAAANT